MPLYYTRFEEISIMGKPCLEKESLSCDVTGENLENEFCVKIDAMYSGRLVPKSYFISLEAASEIKLQNLLNILRLDDREKLKKILDEIETVRSKLDNTAIREPECGECLLVQTDESVTSSENQLINKNSTDLDKTFEVYFGQISVPLDDIKCESFDFRDYVIESESRIICRICGDRTKTGFIYDEDDKLEIDLCKECMLDIAFKCAEIGNNEDVKQDITALRI